jgi:prepilin-type N-terminal cleavage/methylation domain-containing protein
MRHGYTLAELLLVLTLLGLLSLLAIPGAVGLRDRLSVERAARLIVEAHRRAQLLATTEHRVMLLQLTADSLVLSARLAPAATAPRWRHSGPGTEGVAGTGLPRQLAFAPNGIPYGLANNTYTLTRGAARRQVIVSRYGRIQVR